MITEEQANEILRLAETYANIACDAHQEWELHADVSEATRNELDSAKRKLKSYVDSLKEATSTGLFWQVSCVRSNET